MNFKHIQVHTDNSLGFIRLHRPDANNSINRAVIEELGLALDQIEKNVSVIVLEGNDSVFCHGADLAEVSAGDFRNLDPEPLYRILTRLATGPFISVAHVRGKALGGGVGFVAACDIALADSAAEFGLPELLFGLLPACVMPFLLRRVGFQRAQYLTLSTRTITAVEAAEWGLIDDHNSDSKRLLQKNLLRLRRHTKTSVERYKRYMAELEPMVEEMKALAVAANREVFSDPDNLSTIRDFIKQGNLPSRVDKK